MQKLISNVSVSYFKTEFVTGIILAEDLDTGNTNSNLASLYYFF